MISKLPLTYPHLNFTAGNTFMWNPSTKTIMYDPERVKTPQGEWSLLHEVGHAVSNHTTFTTDLELIKIEVEAWAHAEKIAESFGVAIDQNHIQDCLDSYRDWLKKRSSCPDCGTVNLQKSSTEYQCMNCNCHWKVSSSQLCSVRTKTD